MSSHRRFRPAPKRAIGAMVALVLSLFVSFAHAQLLRAPLSGGPDGSVLQHVGQGLASLLSRSRENMEVPYTASAGSKENLQRLVNGNSVFGIVFASDLHRAQEDAATVAAVDPPQVQVLASLFGFHAHILVRQDSGLTDVEALANRSVAVGPAGSSAATAAQHVLESLGLWQRIQPQFSPTLQSIDALLEKQVDAVWILDTVPNPAVMQAMANASLRLLPLSNMSGTSGLNASHPYYVGTVIPEGTYPGQLQAVATLQDALLWVASADLARDEAFEAVSALYAEEGLDFMRSVSHATAELTRDQGLVGITTAMHPGARRYWGLGDEDPTDPGLPNREE